MAKIEALGYSAQWKLLQTVPAVKESSAASVWAEVGPDMGQFASEKHLSSWAGVCPGNNRSAGQNKGSKTNPSKPLVACHAYGMCLGSFRQERVFSEREILATGDQKATQAAGHGSDCAYAAGAVLSGAQERATVPGARSAGPGREAQKPLDLSPRAAPRQTGSSRPFPDS